MRTGALIKNLSQGQKITGLATVLTIVVTVGAAFFLPRDEVSLRGFGLVAAAAALFTALYYGTGLSKEKGWLLASDLFFMPAVTLSLFYLGSFAPFFFYLYFLNLAMDAAIYDWKNYRLAIGITLASIGLGHLLNPATYTVAGAALVFIEWSAVILVGSLFWLYAQEAVTEKEERARAEREAQHFAELEKVKSDFLALASHEMRTPLGHIKGYLDQLRRRKSPEAIDRIDANIDRMLRLISQMLSVMKLEEQTSPKQTEVHLSTLLRDLGNEFVPKAEEKGIQLTLSLPENEVVIPGYPLELREAMTNLLDNALRYTRSEGRVMLRLEQAPQAVRIIVQDTGVGIPQEEQPFLMSKFYRAANVKEMAPSGSGLGLYLVKRIIEAHGGTVTVNSQKDRGTTVTVTLPSARAKEDKG